MKRFWTTGVPSRASWLWLATGLGWAFGTFLYSRRVAVSDVDTRAIWHMGVFLISAAITALIFITARMTRPRTPLSSRRWMIAGVASASGALGVLVLTWYDVVVGVSPPSPGLADALFVLQYPLMAMALIGTALSYRGLVRTRGWGIAVAVFSAVATSVLWFTVLHSSLFTEDVLPASAFMSAYYPLADVVAGIGPALFLLAVASRVGGGVHRWPWMSVALGILVLTASDLVFAVLTAQGIADAAGVVGYTWVVGRVLIGFGALLAADLVRDHR